MQRSGFGFAYDRKMHLLFWGATFVAPSILNA
jgi:hypothetical protein